LSEQSNFYAAPLVLEAVESATQKFSCGENLGKIRENLGKISENLHRIQENLIKPLKI